MKLPWNREPEEKKASIFDRADAEGQRFKKKYKGVIQSIIQAFEDQSIHRDVGLANKIVDEHGGQEKVSGRVEYRYDESSHMMTVRYVRFVNEQGTVAEFQISLPKTVSVYDVPKLMQEVLHDPVTRHSLNFYPLQQSQQLGLFSIGSDPESISDNH